MSIFEEDFAIERKDRERMASELSDLKGSWKNEIQTLKENVIYTQACHNIIKYDALLASSHASIL